jgi:hypothetical protein
MPLSPTGQPNSPTSEPFGAFFGAESLMRLTSPVREPGTGALTARQNMRQGAGRRFRAQMEWWSAGVQAPAGRSRQAGNKSVEYPLGRDGNPEQIVHANSDICQVPGELVMENLGDRDQDTNQVVGVPVVVYDSRQERTLATAPLGETDDFASADRDLTRSQPGKADRLEAGRSARATPYDVWVVDAERTERAHPGVTYPQRRADDIRIPQPVARGQPQIDAHCVVGPEVDDATATWSSCNAKTGPCRCVLVDQIRRL